MLREGRTTALHRLTKAKEKNKSSTEKPRKIIKDQWNEETTNGDQPKQEQNLLNHRKRNIPKVSQLEKEDRMKRLLEAKKRKNL
ncbi:hypothetical protein [Neobacillus sp. 19]|uniref:hypothetical protein n=1 Tax=Neobacillus sp. 19 TaxID=3394458 RepID=UPI003C2AB45F